MSHFVGIPLVPAHAVAEVGRELVMEVVVPLAVGDEGEQPVVARRSSPPCRAACRRDAPRN